MAIAPWALSMLSLPPSGIPVSPPLSGNQLFGVVVNCHKLEFACATSGPGSQSARPRNGEAFNTTNLLRAIICERCCDMWA
jgi:hypothetical protein